MGGQRGEGALKVRFRRYSYNKRFKTKLLVLKGSQGGLIVYIFMERKLYANKKHFRF